MATDPCVEKLAKINRRKLIKIGASVGFAALTPVASSTAPSAQSYNTPTQDVCTGPPYISPHGVTHRVAKVGYKNNANRSAGNGPMDNTTRQIVSYAQSFSESHLTNSISEILGQVMVDSIGCVIAGSDSEPARVSAKISKMNPAGSLKSTVMGYGITSTPDLAAFAGSCMIRHNDFNDNGLHGGHYSDILPAILAVGEAVQSSGSEVATAVVLGYELLGALEMATSGTSNRGWDSLFYTGPAAAVAVGKLLKLNDDQLANALSLSMVPHIPMNPTHSAGPLSMWKGCHSAEALRCAVFANLLAREGMTGPCAPFEGKKGLWDTVTGPFKDFRLPAGVDETDWYRQPGQTIIEGIMFKRFPSEGNSQATLEGMPQFKQFAKPDDIAAINVQMRTFGEIADDSKWDPRNAETADHSLPYLIARALIEGEIYLDSFTEEKVMDPVARHLMDITVIEEKPELRAGPRITVLRKDGQEMTKEMPIRFTRMTVDEVNKKFDRICAFKGVSDDQRDKIRATWSNIRMIKNISDPIRALSHFGHPIAI